MLSEDIFDIKANTEGECGGNNDQQVAMSCCFQGPAGASNNDTTFYPTFRDNQTDILGNLKNQGCGPNPYNAPVTF